MQALKDVALRLLNVYVSPYVENLNAHDLSLSVFGGNIQFHGLHLKKTLLERFGLPVEIVAGDIGNLSVSIPWTQLKTQPVKINIDDVYVLARVRPPGKVDPEEDERIEQATKQERLKKAEEVDNAASEVGAGPGADDSSKQTYVGAIISKVVDNVQVHINNIHVRYEDGSSTPDHPFAAGITLTEFTAVSTDSDWVEAFIHDSLHGVHKLVKLGALSVYFDTDTASLDKGPEDREGTLAALKTMLQEEAHHQYILKPVTGEARVILNKTMSSEMPKIDAQVIFDEIGIVFDRDQYRDALSVIDVFHFYRRTHQYYRFHVPEEESEKNPAMARWKFALNAISSEVHDRNKRWSWSHMAERRDTRTKYVELFMKKLALPEGKIFPAEDDQALSAMERKLAYEDIRFFRSVARAQAKKDAATRRKLQAEQRLSQPTTQTWSQWLWGAPKTEDGESGISEEEKKELDDIIDYDAVAAASSQSAPREFMRTRVSAKLNKGSFSLRADTDGKNKDIIALVFDSFSADALQLTESVSGKIALGGFRVYDGTTPDSLYPQIVRVKDIENGIKGSKSHSKLSIGGTGEALEEISSGLASNETTDPFFVMEVEQNPLDGRADNAVTVKMRHLEIIYHKGYVEAIVAFFKPPASQLESINALLDAAGQTLDGIRKETRAGLEYALEQHKTVDLHVDMNAPIIIIPMDVKSNTSQAIVLDAGHIAIQSDLADQDQLKEVQSKRGQQYNDQDFRRLEDLMYDKRSIRLDSTQLLIGPSVESCMWTIDHPHEQGESDLHIVERINMSFTVQNAIVNSPNLTRFKIAGELPELQVNFSDRKYKSLMKFIEVSVPHFGDDSEAPKDEVVHTHHSVSRPSYRNQHIEEYTLDDTRSLTSHKTADDEGSIDDKGNDQFYDTKDDTTEGQRAAMQQVTFAFSFSVGKLQALLYKSTSPTTERALAKAVLEGFGLDFSLRQYDMSVDLFLRTVTLGMVENGELRKPLLSSAHIEDASKTDLKLIQVRYCKVQKQSPAFMTEHEGVDTSIDVELSTFNIGVAAEPILSLYDFIMTTFVSNEEQAKVESEKGLGAVEADPEAEEKSTDKLRIRVKLTSIHVSLENNGQRFALLALPSADVALMLRSGTMRIGARLGNISLEDVSSDDAAVPEFKKLLTIEGEELADFSYETFDPSDEETFPGYNSSIHLRAGSLKFTFMEKPIRELSAFATKFARMKAVYDAASQAAVQRASEVTRMHYDVMVKTPIIVLPRDGTTSPDVLILKLGEIAAQNKYLGDPNDTSTIKAGLRGINVASQITVDGKTCKLQVVDDVAITADITQIGGTAHRSDAQVADREITTVMSNVKMSLTQHQYVLVMEVLQAIPRALAGEEEEDESEFSTPASSNTATPLNEVPPSDRLVNLEPELAVVKSSDPQKPDLWTTLSLKFTGGNIALEIYTVDALDEKTLEQHSIARFTLHETHVGMKQLSDGSMEADFSLASLSFLSTRAGNSVFRDIIPSTTHKGKQVMVQYTRSGDGAALAIVDIDSPRFILAVDPLGALLEFAMSPFKAGDDDEAKLVAIPEDEEPIEVEGPTSKPGQLALRVGITDATVIVLANDSDPRSQAIQLSIKEVLVSQQSIVAIKVDKIGMSFGRMDRPNDRVRFLDELNVALSLDTRQRGSQQMSSFEIDIPDPVIFRASYSDIMLILDIVNKASAAATRATAREVVEDEDSGKDKGKSKRRSSIAAAPPSPSRSKSTAPTKSGRRASSTARRRKTSLDNKTRVIVSKEQLKASIKGFQFVLVGDLQELPFVHLKSEEFQVAINDWSTDLKMATSITTSIRYFNLTNSHFEPLMDPWKFDLKVIRTTLGPGQKPLSVRFSAAERLELNLTSAFIELAITTMTVLSKEGDRISEGRGNDAPFKIRNRTGVPMAIWPEPSDTNKDIKKSATKLLVDGAEVPWRFEDRRHTRDNVSAVRHNSLGVKLEECAWTEPLRSISVDREGQQILSLRPKVGKVTHQIMCEIALEKNIKVITFRSTLNVENNTSLPIEMIIVDGHGKAWGGAVKIDPGQSSPIPLEAVYEHRFRLRPLKGFGFDYGWSTTLHWSQLVKRPIRPIGCKHTTAGEPAFYFQAQAVFDPKDPIAKSYPRMTLNLRAPVELENLLPYDLKFRIHDKNTGLSSSNFLVKGGISPIHSVELSHLLLLSVAPEDINLKQSDYAIINTDDPELPIEDHFHLTDAQGIKLMLKLHYFTFPNSGGAFKVQVYSPFILLNKTGLPFDLAAKTWSGGQRAVAGSDLFANDYQKDAPTPFMFGFPNDDRRNKLYLKVKDSRWSNPLSFQPAAADMQIVMPSSKTTSDYYVGLSYTEGLGKYKLTKVITIAPRFILINNFKHPLFVRQYGLQKSLRLPPNARVPLLELQSRLPRQLVLGIAEAGEWSTQFNVDDIGRINLVLPGVKSSKRCLMRVDTHIEDSTVFTYISHETEPWPLKLKNDTEYDLMFQQFDSEGQRNGCKPVKLGAHSAAEYAWDQPTVPNKRIRLYLNGAPVGRPIDMMAIGVQPPVKVRPDPNSPNAVTVSMDIQADGNSQVLVISPYNETTSVYKPTKQTMGGVQHTDSSESLATTAFETVAVNEKPNLSIVVEFEGIGISVITKRCDELLYLSVRGLKIGYSDYPQYYDAYVDCKWIQIDNQLFGGLFPIILYPTVVPKDGKELESHPTLQASVAILKDQSHGVYFIKYATILLQAMTIELDEDFLFALMDFAKFKDAAWKEPTADVLIEHPKGIPEPDITAGKADVFFESLQLQPMALELSFMRTDRVNVDEKVSTRNPFYYALNALTMTLGNVNAAPLAFRALFLENVRLSVPSLEERIQLHYQEQFVAQIYRVLGSADFLGNPVGLFNNISSGVSDIFYEPYQGIVVHGNKDIGLGIARGATSFAKKTVFGISDSVTKFTSSIGKGLSAATLDAEYQSKRRMTQRRNKPKHALYGVAAGASAFADSVTSAFEGVASKPMEGAERDGAAGFAKGVGKGFVGLFTKPVIGVMDFVSASTEGIRNTTTVFDQNDIDRVRLPRFIASDGVLRSYNQREALGQSWLKDLDAGAYFNESYIAHLDIPGDDAVSILSNQRLLYVQILKLKVIWQVPFGELESLSLESTGIALYFEGKRAGPFIPIPEKTSREWYFRQIGRVVSAYNKANAQKGDERE